MLTGEKSSKHFAMHHATESETKCIYKSAWHLCTRAHRAQTHTLIRLNAFNIEMIDRLVVAGVPI